MSNIDPHKSAFSNLHGRPKSEKVGREPQTLQGLLQMLKEPFKSNCERCSGSGLTAAKSKCETCKGKGKIFIDLL